MRLMESDHVPVEGLAGYHVVLAELRRVGRAAEAEALAWAAMEAITGRTAPSEALRVAGAFLLALGDGADLRKQVAALYRSAYSDCEGLEALLQESGIEGGRPVRRALRTLEVCLAVKPGDFLTRRDDDGAAKILAIDRGAWDFHLSLGRADETLGAVLLADAYQPSSATDFRVMRQFAPDRLAERLQKAPATVVVDLCRRRGDRIDTAELEALLVPDLLSAAEWKKWWTKARADLKQNPQVTVDGRSPYVITYSARAASRDDAFLVEFAEIREPLAQLTQLERYVREAKARKESPAPEVLARCYELLAARTHKKHEQHAASAAVLALATLRAAELAGVTPPLEEAVAEIASVADLPALFHKLDSDVLVDWACTCLERARPADWQTVLLAMLPGLLPQACDRVAARLAAGGCTPAEFTPAVQQILAAPDEHFDALLWLWDGPSAAEQIGVPPLVTVLVRLLRTLEESRRSDTVPKETVKEISARARAILPARRYERFRRCLEGLEPGMALALKTQIARSESLARAVREDLLQIIREKFPSFDAQREVEPWAREDVIFVTRLGLARKQEEIEQHVNVKMRDNARAIGHAAELGDLSENSEYKFALEERDLLRARLAQMNAEVAMAKVIAAEEVSTDRVGIGTRVVFVRQVDNQRYEMTFVGPWEADAGKGLYNYKAPLCQKLMGKRVGDVVDFDHLGAVGTYTIAEIHNGLS